MPSISYPIYIIQILIKNPYEDLQMSVIETITVLTQLRKVNSRDDGAIIPAFL